MADFSDLEKMIRQQYDGFPPVKDWHPSHVGEIDIHIDSKGDWYHEGGRFERAALIQLFSKLLRREADDYFLVTPTEKLRIRVEVMPFVVTQVDWAEAQDGRVLLMTTSTEEQFVVDCEHDFFEHRCAAGQFPCVWVRDGLGAMMHRNVYYYLAQQAELLDEQLVVVTANGRFALPELE